MGLGQLFEHLLPVEAGRDYGLGGDCREGVARGLALQAVGPMMRSPLMQGSGPVVTVRSIVSRSPTGAYAVALMPV